MAEDKTKCLVHGCRNRKDQGGFVGNLCVPCYEMLTTGKLGSNDTFIHRMAAIHLEQLNEIMKEVGGVKTMVQDLMSTGT